MLTHLQSHTAQEATNVASGIYYKHKKREINAYEQRLPPARYIMRGIHSVCYASALCGHDYEWSLWFTHPSPSEP